MIDLSDKGTRPHSGAKNHLKLKFCNPIYDTPYSIPD